MDADETYDPADKFTTKEGDWQKVEVNDHLAAQLLQQATGDFSKALSIEVYSPNTMLRAEVAAHLGRYVYMLIDPRDGLPFYVGKGTLSRVLQHGLDAKQWEPSDNNQEQKKLAQITAIRAAGHDVDVWILRRKMTESEYTAVESTVIDLLLTLPVAPTEPTAPRKPLKGGTALTNKVRGSNTANGIERLNDIIRDYSVPKLATARPLLLVTLGPWYENVEPLPGGGTRAGQGFKPEWTNHDLLAAEIETLGESACCWWKLNPKVVEEKRIEYIVALYQGVTRGLFRIVDGQFATIQSTTAKGKKSTRTGYIVEPVTSGTVWNEVIGEHGYRVDKKKGEMSPARYWPYTS